MRNLFIVLMVCLSFNSIAQECKYKRNETDKFTGNVIKETKEVAFFYNKLDPQSNSLFFTFTKIDSICFLSPSKYHFEIISITKGAKLSLIFSDSEIINFEAMKSEVAEPEKISWQIDVDYIISEEQLKSLQTKLITDVRIYTNSGYVEDKVSSKLAEKIKAAANCIK